jgi:hypothetical protein
MALTQVQGQMLTGSSNTTTTIQSNGTTAITIDSSQNVGIGTATPNDVLNLYKASRPYLIMQNATTGTTSSDGFWIGYDSSNLDVQIRNKESAGLLFFSNDTERMRISSSGVVGIGQDASAFAQLQVKFDATTAANNSLGIGIAPAANTSNAMFMQFYNATGNGCGSITRNGTSNAVLYNTSSDYRLKENIAPMTGALAKVQSLKPVTWTWKDGGQTGEGFIAHEVQEVVPSAVSGEKDAIGENGKEKYQGMDASYLVATLTAAIQEQQAIITDLKARIETLEAK